MYTVTAVISLDRQKNLAPKITITLVTLIVFSSQERVQLEPGTFVKC